MKKKIIWIVAIVLFCVVAIFCAFEFAGVTQVFIKPPSTPPPPAPTEIASPTPRVIKPSGFGQKVNAPVKSPKNISTTKLNLKWNYSEEQGINSFKGFGLSADVEISSYGIFDWASEDDISSWNVTSEDKSKLYLKNKKEAQTKIKKFLESHKYEEFSDYTWAYQIPICNGIASILSREYIYDNEYRYLGTKLKGILNLDIRTGEEFDLRAVFADNVDAEKELNKFLSLYILSTNEDEIYKFKGIDMQTPFWLDFEEKYLVLFPNEKTPLLNGKEIKIPFASLGNNGDVIAVFERFPALKKDEFDLASWKKDAAANIDSEAKNYYEHWQENQRELWKQRMLEGLDKITFANIFTTQNYDFSKKLYTQEEIQKHNNSMP